MISTRATRKEALAHNEPRYNTGKPCRRGHTADRYTANGACTQCQSHSVTESQSHLLKRQARKCTTNLLDAITNSNSIISELNSLAQKARAAMLELEAAINGEKPIPTVTGPLSDFVTALVTGDLAWFRARSDIPTLAEWQAGPTTVTVTDLQDLWEEISQTKVSPVRFGHMLSRAGCPKRYTVWRNNEAHRGLKITWKE